MRSISNATPPSFPADFRGLACGAVQPCERSTCLFPAAPFLGSKPLAEGLLSVRLGQLLKHCFRHIAHAVPLALSAALPTCWSREKQITRKLISPQAAHQRAALSAANAGKPAQAAHSAMNPTQAHGRTSLKSVTTASPPGMSSATAAAKAARATPSSFNTTNSVFPSHAYRLVNATHAQSAWPTAPARPSGSSAPLSIPALCEVQHEYFQRHRYSHA